MVRQTASMLILEILGGLILLVLVAAGLLAFRLASGPLELGVFRDDVERALTDARSGRSVKIGEVFLEWSQDDRRVLINAKNVQLFDDAGSLSAEAETADITLAGSSLVFGKVEIIAMHLDDGWINVDSVTETKWKMAGDPLPEIPSGTLPTTPAEWLERANDVLPQLLVALEQAETVVDLERVSFDQFEVHVRDADQKNLLTLRAAKGRLAREAGGIVLSISGSGVGEGLPAGLAATLATSNLGNHLKAEFAVAKWPLGDLAVRLGMSRDRFDGLPANVAVSFDVSRGVGVEQILVDIAAGEGRLPLGGNEFDVQDFGLKAAYNSGTDGLTLEASSNRAGPLKGRALLNIQDAMKGQGFRKFNLTSPDMQLDFAPAFESAIPLEKIYIEGEVDLSRFALRDAVVDFTTGGDRLTASGSIELTPDRQEGEPPVIGSFDIASQGDIRRETVLAFWPVGLGAGARRYAANRITSGVASSVEGHMDLLRDSFAEGYLKDENLTLDFQVRDASVRFLDDLPAVENATGKGRLTGNGFKVVLDSGEYGGWTLDEGLVDFPAFNPRGVPFRVFAKGRGPAKNIMKTLVESRFKIEFEPDRLTGDAEMTFEMFRPALDNVPYEDVRFSALGTVTQGGLKQAALGFDLTKGSFKIDANQAGVTVSGFGDLGPSPVQFTWRDAFSDGDQPSNLSATAVVTPDLLNRFGVLGRAYLSGEIPIELQARVAGDDLISADTSLDLGEARLDISEIGWVKPKGVPAKASIQFEKVGSLSRSTVLFTSENARLDGEYMLSEDSKLVSAIVRRAYLKNKADFGGDIARAQGGGLIVQLEGTYLDLSGVMSGLGASGSADAGNTTPLNISANLDALTLRPGLDMREAKLMAKTGSTGLSIFTATGKADDGSPFSATYDATVPDGATVNITSGNAGFMAQAWIGADFLEGGNLDLTGKFTKDGSPADFDIVLTDVRMRNAPFLTQILSLASLRGLADTLGGEGVLFSRIDVPLKFANGRYVVTGAKAQGPALGLTTSGFLQADDGTIEFNGVLVPSFGMNSALGGIPIIGDLVVGRDGEGVFSLTYAVNGTLEKANVSVNPLSALAPGVIRRIFENPSDTKIPEAKPRLPHESIPSELPPIPEESFE
ncbi:MAG: hypothetical protein VR74_07245 [Hyphomonas sp. BRH_c22]|uniref:YhdP family protein n=1 Tax=Hyphomonas sp. BRH_c22 TaxID=1629710 RepID=UPI0005F174D2|nr:AsmA-like C-terminal region-containing protein [Hyphomonas sp. BRH_c22]KJS37887.1 MAG: hypothetical protein VR74_07245 [Hyphomonas sp. BRH_c22]